MLLNRTAKLQLIAGLAASLLGTQAVIGESFGKVDPASLKVSMVQLIADPAKFDGAKVRVAGVILFEGDGDALCLSEEAAKYLNLMNCLALRLDDANLGADRDELLDLSGEHVLLEGIFAADDRGRYGLAVGTIRGVSRMTPLEPENGQEERTNDKE